MSVEAASTKVIGSLFHQKNTHRYVITNIYNAKMINLFRKKLYTLLKYVLFCIYLHSSYKWTCCYNIDHLVNCQKFTTGCEGLSASSITIGTSLQSLEEYITTIFIRYHKIDKRCEVLRNSRAADLAPRAPYLTS